MNFQSEQKWTMMEKNVIITNESPDKFSEMRKNIKKENFRLRFATLPEMIKIYMNKPSLFSPFYYNEKRIELTGIITDTNEILGEDLEGVVYGKKERLIVHTHGIYIPNETNNESNGLISQRDFNNLIKGKVRTIDGKEKEVKVYKEDELKRKRKSRIDFPCITIIRGEKYFRDPGYYCNEIEYTQLPSGLEKNGLLMSRTLQEPSQLLQFIKEETRYFSQTSPLIEPVIFRGSNNLFSKYAYRVMPLILCEGEIFKDAKDKIDTLETGSRAKDKYFAFIVHEKE